MAAGRRQLLSDDHRDMDPAELRQAWLDLHESWLIVKAAQIGIADDSGYAIVGVGGLGRRELLPYSDLDLVLLHDGKPVEELGDVADALWYPLWDASIRLDHSVRTVSDALGVAGADMAAALGMLEARHIVGDQQLSASLIDGVRRQWRSGIRSRMNELVDMTHDRWLRCGRVANRAEPDLKSGRGGLRDVQLLDALAIAQLIDRHGLVTPDMPVGSLDAAYLTLLNVRTELHRVSGRGRDLLLAQHADDISAALHFGDRFDLARMLSSAGRTIAYHAESGLRTACNALPGAASQPCGGAPSGARWTRAWSNVPTKSCWPAMPNPNKMPVWCCGWPPRRPTPGCRSVPPRCAGWPTALRNCRRRGPERSSTTCWRCCWPVLPRW
ncbi:glnD PII-uridylyltransferase family protein [Mycobacterium ulcerans str. Harvey]|uniref:GlnD PII-uridylyltransferase family protein n=1 Tax=Mycobacterium ulcerans str. Harvey TaxID=1299332 RepID=A0ABN0QZM2_MYCUL|nr:glnD PII-uridylyltransferase family protein [Mycobacterium ulcerans str. Harvey]